MVAILRTLALGGTFGIAALSPALTLSGICGFVTDANGNWNTGWYNTHGPDGGKNGYVVHGASENGAFANSGNGAQTTISIDISAPGYHRIYVFFDGNEIFSPRDFWGINLFFNGQNDAAGISAFTTPFSAGESAPPAFQANGGTTLNVAANQNISGSGALVYDDGTTQVTLKDYMVSKDVYALDRVDNFAVGASGRNDHVTVLGLNVVPEPATLATIGVGLVGALRRRKRH